VKNSGRNNRRGREGIPDEKKRMAEHKIGLDVEVTKRNGIWRHDSLDSGKGLPGRTPPGRRLKLLKIHCVGAQVKGVNLLPGKKADLLIRAKRLRAKPKDQAAKLRGKA